MNERARAQAALRKLDDELPAEQRTERDKQLFEIATSAEPRPLTTYDLSRLLVGATTRKPDIR